VDQVNSTCSGGQGAAHSYTVRGVVGRRLVLQRYLEASAVMLQASAILAQAVALDGWRAQKRWACGFVLKQAEAEIKAVATSSEPARSRPGSQ